MGWTWRRSSPRRQERLAKDQIKLTDEQSWIMKVGGGFD
jgi:hypothetical protein